VEVRMTPMLPKNKSWMESCQGDTHDAHYHALKEHEKGFVIEQIAVEASL
jgi:hypothetical protein